jgi:RNA-directed DNA polymerase
MIATASAAAGAVSHSDFDWASIDWRQAEATVRRLQARIVQACNAGRWGRVRALQHLLTHSFAAKVLAVRRVTENKGKRTPGVDGETWTTMEQKMAAVRNLRQRGYQPQPLRRVYVPKRNGKRRPWSIATMHDRAMQTVFLFALDPVAEVQADPNSYGFRVGRSTADAIDQCYNVLVKPGSAQFVLEGDIRACFDSFDQEWLEGHIMIDTKLLRRWLKAGYREHGRLYPTERGAAQGGPISPAIANCALNGLEGLLARHYPPRRKPYPQVHFIRYSDDFVITGRDRSHLETEVKPLVETFLQERGLTLSPEKTVITPISEGVDFLGQHLQTYRGRLRVTPAAKNVSSFLAKVRTTIRKRRQAPTGELIEQLNAMIRGWAFPHRHVSSSRAYARVDHAIFRTLWAWARRRHPNKGAGWVRKRYFHTVGNRTWVFSGTVPGPDGTKVMARLYAATSCRFQRHTKVQAHANPYDPAWYAHFAQRRSRRPPVQVSAELPETARRASSPASSHVALPFAREASEGLEPCAVMNRTHGS